MIDARKGNDQFNLDKLLILKTCIIYRNCDKDCYKFCRYMSRVFDGDISNVSHNNMNKNVGKQLIDARKRNTLKSVLSLQFNDSVNLHNISKLHQRNI